MPDGTLYRRRRRSSSPADGQWPLDRAITVVLFAGLGGACAGLEEAGCPVAVANNHDDVALAAHAALHPHTRHVRGDIFDVDPLQATQGRPVKVLWASPDCRDHSVAKGGAPRSPRVRSLPWQVCRWAGKTRPQVIFIENVREIRGWGPLVAKRDPATGRVLKADGSVAAAGERVPVQQQQLVRDKARVGRSFRRWRDHLRRLGYAYEDRDLNCADFGVPTSRRRFWAIARCDGRPIRWPEPTHARRGEAEAMGLSPWRAAAEILDWSLPCPSIFGRKKALAPATERRIAVGLKRFVLEAAQPFIVPITHTSSLRAARPADEPLPTLTTARGGELAVMAPHVTKFRKGSVGADASEPLPTITANGHSKREGGAIPLGVAAAYLVQTGYGERPGQAPRTLDIEAPIGTMVDGAKHAVVAAWMAKHNLGVVGNEASDPVATLTTAGTQIQLAGAFLTKLRGTGTANSAEEPVPTLTSGGEHIAPAAAFLTKFNENSPGQPLQVPIDTVMAGAPRFGAVAAFLTKYYGEGSVAQAATDPLHTLSTLARFGVVTVAIGGEVYAVADIGMRMLAPHEAAAAHELKLPAEIMVNGTRRRLTKAEAMRLIGNSVPKRMAYLLARENIVHALSEVAA